MFLSERDADEEEKREAHFFFSSSIRSLFACDMVVSSIHSQIVQPSGISHAVACILVKPSSTWLQSRGTFVSHIVSARDDSLSIYEVWNPILSEQEKEAKKKRRKVSKEDQELLSSVHLEDAVSEAKVCES